ncbi:MAG: histidine phosphatase family protein [Candidatus Marsarchaeota archaeon]|nr:histidine phosphatase family protein [Candidatus Marsarchaeota archaeon]
MRVLVFVRHAQAESNARDILASTTEGYPLTDSGKAQALRTAKMLKDVHFDVLYSSPIRRALETARILNRYHGLQINVDKRLTERGFGKLEGKNANDGAWELPMLEKRKFASYIESFDSMVHRVGSFAESVPEGTTSLIVSHESTISYFARSIIGYDAFSGKGITTKNAAVTVIARAGRKYRLLAIGSFSVDAGYLKELLKDAGLK